MKTINQQEAIERLLSYLPMMEEIWTNQHGHILKVIGYESDDYNRLCIKYSNLLENNKEERFRTLIHCSMMDNQKFDPTKVNLIELKEILNVNKSSPVHPLGMAYFARKSECGTTACLLGNWVLTHSRKDISYKWNNSYMQIEIDGQKMMPHTLSKRLGITTPSCQYLFFHQTDDLAIDRLEKFINVVEELLVK